MFGQLLHGLGRDPYDRGHVGDIEWPEQFDPIPCLMGIPEVRAPTYLDVIWADDLVVACTAGGIVDGLFDWCGSYGLNEAQHSERKNE